MGDQEAMPRHSRTSQEHHMSASVCSIIVETSLYHNSPNHHAHPSPQTRPQARQILRRARPIRPTQRYHETAVRTSFQSLLEHCARQSR